MSNQDLSKIIFDRLAQQYGVFLTIDELAAELRLTTQALQNRRYRGRTGGMPEPLRDVHPLQYRAAEVARWLAGERVSTPPSGHDTQRRGPGRPRKVAPDGVGRAVGRG